MCLDEHQVALVVSLQVVNIHPGFQVSLHRYVASPESWCVNVNPNPIDDESLK